MKRRYLGIVAAVLLLAAGCATVNKSPLNQAKLAYVDASLTYETTMQTLTTLRANHQINDAQWARIAQGQALVRASAPAVRTALDLWESTGTQPASYPQLIASFTNALGKILTEIASIPPAGGVK